MRPPLSAVAGALPALLPFRSPEQIERELGQSFELRLGANESPFGVVQGALQAMQAQLSQAQNYPDCSYEILREKIGQWLGVRASEVVIGPGIDGLLSHVARAYLTPGDVVVMSRGTYPTFAYAVNGVGVRVETIEYRNDAPDLEGLLDGVHRHRAKAVYLADPDNPSGALTTSDSIMQFLRALPADVVCFLDEAYFEYADAMPVFAPADFPNVFRFRTFSKVYGLAGMRIAYVVSDESTIEPLNRVRMHFEVNRLGVAAAMGAMESGDEVRQIVKATRLGREDYAQLATSLGLTTLPSHTNFVCIDVGNNDRAAELVTKMAKAGVFVRMPWAPPLDRCIRVTVARSEQRARFAEIFRTVFGEM